MKINPQKTFDNFNVKPSNKFAYAAAKAVVTNLKDKCVNYNPLFIYGKENVGKTHLLNAIYNEIKKEQPDIKIVYITAEEFINEYSSCITEKSLDELRKKYSDTTDVLLIDDIQFVADKRALQNELLNIIDSFIKKQKILVISANNRPNEITGITKCLQDRFECGLITDIVLPEKE